MVGQRRAPSAARALVLERHRSKRRKRAWNALEKKDQATKLVLDLRSLKRARLLTLGSLCAGQVVDDLVPDDGDVDEVEFEDPDGEMRKHANVYLKWTRENFLLRLQHLQFSLPGTGAHAYVLEHAPSWVLRCAYVPLEVKTAFVVQTGAGVGVGPEAREEAIALLCDYMPGFLEVWNYYYVDLFLTVRPFWDWEEGISETLLHHLPLIAALFAYYQRPTLTRCALVTLDLVLYYSDTGEGRPDIYVVICRNCQAMTEKLQEIANGYQGVFVSWHKELTAVDFNRAAMTCAARVACIFEEGEHIRGQRDGGDRKRRRSHIEREHDMVERGPKWEETRALALSRIIATFVSAMRGDFAYLAGKLPDKITEGRILLREALPKFQEYLDGTLEKYDPLFKPGVPELLKLCEQFKADEGVVEDIPDLSRERSKKPRLVAWLRLVGYKGHGWQDFVSSFDA
jgi:hypothetical protein